MTRRLLLLASLGWPIVVMAENPAYRSFDSAHLVHGRTVWLENCETCHGYGIAGAPVPMQPEEWRERLEQDQPILHRHAIEGFFGPEDTMMPPRGGNDELTDDQVRAAVDYMTALARFYIQQAEKAQ